MSESFDGPALLGLLTSYAHLLAVHEEEINALNVFPVADGDTGTNMLSTVQAVVDALDGAEVHLGAMSRRASRAALRSARGSSGIIFSQWLRGFLHELPAEGPADSTILARALSSAADSAYSAVEEPVEGTILTVARAAADAAAGTSTVRKLWQVSDRAADEALARTPELLPVLKRHGVVDSGARALALLFDAAGDTSPTPVSAATGANRVRAEIRPPDGAGLYEVMFLLSAPSATPLLDGWRGLGDAIAVSGDASDGFWSCHIHTDDPDAAVEVGRSTGEVSDIRIESLPGQCRDEGVDSHTGHLATGVVAIAVGDGLAARMQELGAVVVLCARTMNASTGEVAEAIETADADSVLVLPGDADTVAACEAACELAREDARVVPALSLSGAIACLETWEPELTTGANEAAMSLALDAPWIEIAPVVRAAETPAGPVSVGDWVVIDRTGILHASDAAIGAARHGLERIPAASALEIYPGAAATADMTEELVDLVRRERPDTDVVLRAGNQPHQAWLFRVPLRGE